MSPAALRPSMKEELDEKESEILGIMFGDGSVRPTLRSLKIEVSGHKVDDRDYLLDHVSGLFREVFGLEMRPYYRKKENSMVIYAYSQQVGLELHEWGMPIGSKVRAILVPRVSVKAVPFIRGLFDTDGCIYRKYGPYAQVQFKSASKELMDYARGLLLSLGFRPTAVIRDESRFKFYICRQIEVVRFIRVIRPANKKHMKRFKAILKGS